MNVQDLINILFPSEGQKQLTEDQQNIVKHPQGPAWILAGPGSGKTEVLTLLVLRLLYVENDVVQKDRVPPEAIIVTTFTDKAARNLEDRISFYRAKVVGAYPELSKIDVSKLRIGTLHGLCNDILQEFRALNYQNVRLMDEFEQALFVREHMSFIKHPNTQDEINFWKEFPWMFKSNEWQPHYLNIPKRWISTKKLIAMLNRLVENRVSISALKTAGGQLKVLADLYDEYVTLLHKHFRCDFSQLQARFLEFLKTPLGRVFRDGNIISNSGIKWVLVDEYQDTNPIQEEIYFELSNRSPYNLVVVGDDDQAMYRFRGGSVECMVTFDNACNVFLGIPKANVSSYPLVDNFRSHKDIVSFFNNYINAFPVMAKPGSRVKKTPIRAKRNISQNYTAVGCLSGTNISNLADIFAKTIKGLVDNKKVNDPSECCLLLKSTKESTRNAQKYVEALHDQGFNVYNPRNKAFAEQEEVQGLLGALLAVVDPDRRYSTDHINKNIIPDEETRIRTTYDRIASENEELANYIIGATAALKANPGKPLDASLQELVYYLISMEPFNTWQRDPVRRLRLGKLTKLFEAYSSMPIHDFTTGLPRPNVSRGFMKASDKYPGEVDANWLRAFYHLFLGYVLEAGFDDEEDDEVIVPPGLVPIMTMHQSKGLEFPFVFVGHLSENPSISISHELETLFSNYPTNSTRVFSRAPAIERAQMDLIRQYYVAYSRAKYALILLGTKSQFKNKSVPLGPDRDWIRHKIQLL